MKIWSLSWWLALASGWKKSICEGGYRSWRYHRNLTIHFNILWFLNRLVLFILETSCNRVRHGWWGHSSWRSWTCRTTVSVTWRARQTRGRAAVPCLTYRTCETSACTTTLWRIFPKTAGEPNFRAWKRCCSIATRSTVCPATSLSARRT